MAFCNSAVTVLQSLLSSACMCCVWQYLLAYTQSAYWLYGMLKQKRCSWKFTIQKDGIEFFGLENALKKAIFKRLGCI